MSIKSSVRAVRNVFQDAVIRIPYFLSPTKSTSTLAVVFQNEGIGNDIKNITELIKTQTGVLGHQLKLYYEKEINYKTVIIQFDCIASCQNFYACHAKNYEKTFLSEGKEALVNKQPNLPKFVLYFCKDITSSGINMEEVLFTLGKFSVQVPQSLLIRKIVKEVAKLIVVQGIRAEAELMKYKSVVLPVTSLNLLDFMDPKFLSSESIYYRWRVYSYLQGDGETNYRAEPFQMTAGGSLYYPPEEQNQKYLHRILTCQERTFITRLLDGLSCRKYHIEEAMSFCIANTSSAIQICCIIAVNFVESCKKLQAEEENKNVKQSEVKHLVALFYLISDILFNSLSTIYRDIFTVLLPSLIEKLPLIGDLQNKICEIIQMWGKKFILEDQFLRGLNLTVKKDLPSMKPLGMQQMTRSQHECYKQLVKLETTDQIEELCCKYGIMFSASKIQQSLRNLAATMAFDRKQSQSQIQPEPGPYDGEPLGEKDLQKIKSKSCKVVSLEDINVKYLFERDKNSKSVSYQ